MKKILVILLVVGVFLVGCSNITDPNPIPDHPLLSADKNKYSLLIVGETEITDYYKWKEENKITNVKTIHGRDDSLEEINGEYKFLELEKSPAYVVFDSKDVVYKTYSEEKLIEFLKENNPNQ